MIKIAINGLGRIGRKLLKLLIDTEDLLITAVNDLSSIDIIAHLLKYDSTYGLYKHKIEILNNNALFINDKKIFFSNQRSPELIHWGTNIPDIVVDCSGVFRNTESLKLHLKSGAKKVLLSAPPTDDMPIVVYGVNHENIQPKWSIISNASCTTNCLAPIIKTIDRTFSIEKGSMTTVHAFTSDQNIIDSSHKDLRRARSAYNSIIPTSTGAATIIGKIIPHLEGKLNGLALRVPVDIVSIVDFVCTIKQKTDVSEVNSILKLFSEEKLQGIMQYVDEPIVSRDLIGNLHSSIIDSLATQVVDNNMIKILAWYDNESAYAQRLIDVSREIGKTL